MKSVTGYVNQRKLHELLPELRNAGARRVSIIEYSSQPARVSRIRFLCPDDAVGKVSSPMMNIAGQQQATYYTDGQLLQGLIRRLGYEIATYFYSRE